MKRNVFFPIMGLLLLAASCTREEVGPQGPEGPQGPPGNANVEAVIIVNQPFTFNQLANVYQVLVDVPQITGEILSGGTVSAFIAPANSNNTSWTALPGRFSTEITSIPAVHFDFQYSSGSATIYSVTNPAFGNVDLKIVVAAGN
ncbi:hypothetical protein Q0590_24205 [Rhodocytophaga aerolata]|uniref:Collagen-like protein n=1 Tax=Rhodocytophaga aerolata TaxID=455078 RepID=A0ABT8RBE8_9BACT|nr:hypothetical protein [Rhodocytophaga aerolata]MDO1449400.1 hypothetical protein [Rhodocytophaga aerolata]